MTSRIIELLLFFSLLIPLISAQKDYPTSCYVLDGTKSDSAGFRCNNGTTGHSSCCAPGAICYSNGVCQQSNGDTQDYLRVGCTDRTWKDAACLDQCRTHANDSTAGIRFCKGSITSTNQYCCDTGNDGIGSFKCCDSPSSIFAINPVATVLAQIPLTYTSTSKSSSSTSSTAFKTTSSSTASGATAITTTPSAPTASSSSSSKSTTNSAAIGAGVGIPVGLLALAGIIYFFWRRRKNAMHEYELQHGGMYQDDGSPRLAEADGTQVEGNGGKKGYFAGRDYEAMPQELLGDRRVHEMQA